MSGKLTWEERGVLSWLNHRTDIGIYEARGGGWWTEYGGGEVQDRVVQRLLKLGLIATPKGFSAGCYYSITEAGRAALKGNSDV